MKAFKEFLIESKKESFLDIHIKEADKVLTTDKKIEEFLLGGPYRIEEKTDGVKLTIIRNDRDYVDDYKENWIVAYKNYILYPFEHQTVDDKDIANESYGNSQYKFIHNALKKAHKNLEFVPKNTEFFLEYLMNKPTLTRQYSKHAIILLAHSPTTYKINNGKVFSNPIDFIQRDELNKRFTKETGFQEPTIIFSGMLFDSDFKFQNKNIINSGLKYIYLRNKKFITDAGEERNINKLFELISKMFTTYQSSFGSDQIEGSVFYDLENKTWLKFIFHDQYDDKKRHEVKEKLLGTEEEQKKYFSEIDKKANELIKDNKWIENRENGETNEQVLENVSDIIYNLKLDDIDHSKKTNLNKQDDLYLKIKTILLDSFDETTSTYALRKIKDKSNLGMFIGKLRIPTKAHYDIIKNAIKEHPNGLILGLVQTEKDSIPFSIRKDYLQKKFPKLSIIELQSGNINIAMKPFKNMITELYAGEDRKSDYQKQLDSFNKKNSTDIKLHVIPRNNDISSTKLEDAIKNKDLETFKKYSAPDLWFYWKTITSSSQHS